jgi:hypothetical protein
LTRSGTEQARFQAILGPYPSHSLWLADLNPVADNPIRIVPKFAAPFSPILKAAALGGRATGPASNKRLADVGITSR